MSGGAPRLLLAMQGLQHTRCLAAAGISAALLLAGCSDPAPPERPRFRRVRVASFTDAAEVTALAAAPPFVYAATADGLDRWDLSTGRRQAVAPRGAVEGALRALDHDRDGGHLWVASPGGVGRYDLGDQSYRSVPAPPDDLGVDLEQATVIAAAGDGGLWVGSDSGLFYTDIDGHWRATDLAMQVRSIRRTEQRLWVGTAEGLFAIDGTGDEQAIGIEAGCDLVSVDALAPAPDGVSVALGRSDGGAPRIAYLSGDGCSSYRITNGGDVTAAVVQGDRLVLLIDDELYATVEPERGSLRRLSRDQVRLLPIPGAGPRDREPLSLSRIRASVPEGATTLAASRDELFIGTRSLGTLRVESGAGVQRTRWLRRSDLKSRSGTLTAVCHAADDCWLAIGSEDLWHFDGHGFRDRAEAGRIYLAVAQSPRGRTYLVWRDVAEPAAIRLSVSTDSGFTELGTPFIEADTEALIRFARFSPQGKLWLGLSTHNAPIDIAVVDLETGGVSRPVVGIDEADLARDVAFRGGEAWLATPEGAIRITRDGPRLRVRRAEGLRSDNIVGVVSTAAGEIYVASDIGVARQVGDGGWQYPRPLRRETNDVATDGSGRIWVATDRGLMAYDGDRLRRLDMRRGLLEDHVLAIEVDALGRVWLQSEAGLALVTP